MTRLSTFFAALVAVLAFSTVTGSNAMATKGNCDPGPGQVNIEELAFSNGQVRITTHYGWDGVSVFPDCVGAIQDVRVQNASSGDWYVMIPRSRRGTINFRVIPGTDKTYTGAALSQIGLQTNQDITELNWSQTRPAGTVVDLP